MLAVLKEPGAVLKLYFDNLLSHESPNDYFSSQKKKTPASIDKKCKLGYLL